MLDESMLNTSILDTSVIKRTRGHPRRKPLEGYKRMSGWLTLEQYELCARVGAGKFNPGLRKLLDAQLKREGRKTKRMSEQT